MPIFYAPHEITFTKKQRGKINSIAHKLIVSKYHPQNTEIKRDHMLFFN